MPQYNFKGKPSKGHTNVTCENSSLESNVLEVENCTESCCVVYLGASSGCGDLNSFRKFVRDAVLNMLESPPYREIFSFFLGK